MTKGKMPFRKYVENNYILWKNYHRNEKCSERSYLVIKHPIKNKSYEIYVYAKLFEGDN